MISRLRGTADLIEATTQRRPLFDQLFLAAARRRRFTVRRPFVRCATSATQVSALSASASNAARSSFVMPKFILAG